LKLLTWSGSCVGGRELQNGINNLRCVKKTSSTSPDGSLKIGEGIIQHLRVFGSPVVQTESVDM